MKLISIFETMTGAKLKDCIMDDKVIFIVHEQDMGKAIGRKGSNIIRLEKMLNKKVKLIAYSDDVQKFITNMIYPLKPQEITEEDKVITIKGSDSKTKGLMIGRDRQNLNNLISITKRYFDITDIKVI